MKDSYSSFLLKDFEQQYEEYRRAEDSRRYYVKFLSTILIGVLAFFATIFTVFWFPSPSIIPTVFLFFTSLILFFIGKWVINICILTRKSQLQTASYLKKITDHFLKLENDEEIKEVRNEIYFGDDWGLNKTPFSNVLSMLIFLRSVFSSLVTYSVFRLSFYCLSSDSILTDLPIPMLAINWGHIISLIAGLVVIPITYYLFKRKNLKKIDKPQKLLKSPEKCTKSKTKNQKSENITRKKDEE